MLYEHTCVQVIRPSTPTKSITLKFTSIDLSLRYMVDVLYAVPDCNRMDSTTYMEKLVTDQSMNAYVVNGLGREYGVTDTPCPLKFNTDCMVVEFDMTRRYVDSASAFSSPFFFETPENYRTKFKGFSFEYSSSDTEETSPTQWTSGGYTEICQPLFASVKPPKQQIVFNEKCCAEEEGNSIFSGNFFANVSISLPGNLANDEDYRIIYKVEPYSPAGPTYLDRDFRCESDYFDDVELWYPSELSKAQKEDFFKQKWAGTKGSTAYPTRASASTGTSPSTSSNSTTNQTTPAPTPAPTGTIQLSSKVFKAKLWYSGNKVVKIYGKLGIMKPSQILLNAPKASSDRPATVPAMYGQVMISAVTCKANKVGDQTVWIKSEVEVKNEIFSTGPSLAVVLGNLSVPANLVNYDPNANTTTQLALSEPLIAIVRSQLASLAGLSDCQYGVLRQIDAVNITIERPLPAANKRRLNKKTVDILKPGYVPPTIKPPDAGNGNGDSTIFVKVGLTMSILCKSVKDLSRISTSLTQSPMRRQFSLPLNSITVKPLIPADSFTPSQNGGPCNSHYDCVSPGLFCSSQKKCQPCSRCSIDSQDSIDGVCPKVLCPLAGGFPPCIDPKKLVSTVAACKSSYDFELWAFNKIAPKVREESKAR